MKKSFLVVISCVILTLFVAGLFNYLLTGNLVPYYSCGSSFSYKFTNAVKNNDPNFCLTFNGKINQFQEAKGSYYCHTPKVGLMKRKVSLSQTNFKNHCLMAMAEATGDIDICNLPELEEAYYVSCILRMVIATKDKSACELLKNKNEYSYKACLSQTIE